ncbi:hypothetical protein ACO2Q3_09400 [Caulobacter sp. KR2-114]|uniref:hypothetical protein n=1 Tax=Caulobacter sp. KR2-114 TaxID=3400912 RepID=UPI003BFB6E5E
MPATANVVMRRAEPVGFTDRGGRRLWLDFAVETVVNLRLGAPAARRIARAVVNGRTGAALAPADFARLADEDHLHVDLETVDAALAALKDGQPPPILIVPLSFHSLSGRRSRRDLAERLGGEAKGRLMIELMDVDRGTPLGRLSEVGAVAAGLSRGVLVRLSPGRDPAAPVKGYRPHGVTVEASAFGETDSERAAGLLAFAEQVKGAAPTVMTFGLPDDGFFAVAEVAGVSHASTLPAPRE